MQKVKLLFGILVACFCIIVLPQNVCATDISDTATTDNLAIVPKSLETGEEDLTTLESYDLVVPLSTKTLVVPINMEYQGCLNINLIGKIIPDDLKVDLYTDEACTSVIGYSSYLNLHKFQDNLVTKIPSKGIYYLKFTLDSNAGGDAAITITPYSMSSENKTLKNKTWICSYPMSYDDQISHKITISKPGYIKVEAVSLAEVASSTTVTLLNSKNTNLSDSVYLSKTGDNTTYFGVKKGTYYINGKSSDIYKLRYSFVAVTDKGSSTKSKATTILKGKAIKGLVQSTDSIKKADWYKVKLTKKQKLRLNIYAKSNDSLRFEIIPASKNVILWGSIITLYDYDGGVYSTKESMPAGTYYIKVTKKAKTSSGYYTIKFK